MRDLHSVAVSVGFFETYTFLETLEFTAVGPFLSFLPFVMCCGEHCGLSTDLPWIKATSHVNVSIPNNEPQNNPKTHCA